MAKPPKHAVSRRILMMLVDDHSIPARWKLSVAAAATVVLTYGLTSADPWWIVRWLSGDTERTAGLGQSDKLHHFIGYFGLSGLFMWYAVPRSNRTISWMIAGTVTHAVGTEFLQKLAPSRTFDIADLLANVCGVVVACSIGLLTRSLLRQSLRTADRRQVQTA